MAFFNPNQQNQLMAQMFSNPQGQGGMMPPMGGQGGANSGPNIGPSFAGPEGPQGVSNPGSQFGPMPFSGPMPDFQSGPFMPGSDTGIRELGNVPVNPMPYTPNDGYGGRPPIGPMPVPPRGAGPDARPMPFPQDGGRRQPFPGRNGPRNDVTGSGMNAGEMGQQREFNRAREMVGPGVITEQDMADRQKLIEAILRRSYGGM
jgi:hypothetical protein